MSYIGGSLPGQEQDQEYPQDIGKETFQKGIKSISDTYQKLPEPVKKNVSEASRFGGEIFSGLAEMNREARKSNILGLGPLDPFIGATKLYDKAIEGISDITGIYRGYFDLADFFIPATPTALKFSKRLSTTKKAAKLTNVQKLNNISDVSFLAKVERVTGQTNLQTQAASFLNQIDNFDDIFVKGSNTDLSYKRIAKDYRLASGTGLDLPVVEGYKAANPKTWNKYVLSETKHWAQHGKGSGKYFTLKHATDPTQNIRYRLDNKGRKVIDGKTIDRSFSIKNLKHKKIENLTQQDRIQILRDTTLDPATVSAVMKLTPEGTIMHHAAPVKSTGKIQQAFIKGNPNLTSKDYFAIQRRVEKELGIAFGDSPLNQRYPKTIAEHNEYHKLLRKYKVYATDYKFKKLTPNQVYIKLKELGNVVKKIDKEMGIPPRYTHKSIGKEFR